MFKVGTNVTIRLDADLCDKLGRFAQDAGLELPTQALRAAVHLGLSRSQELDSSWRAVVAQETARNVSRQMRELLQRFVSGLA